MKIDELTRAFRRHLQALARAELIIAEIRLGTLLRKIGLVLFAGVVCIFGLAMLNAAAFRALVPIWGDVIALVAVAIGDFVIAGILVAIASRKAQSSDLELAGQLRDQAIDAIELDARIAADQATDFVRRPLQAADWVTSLITSILGAFIKHRKKGS